MHRRILEGDEVKHMRFADEGQVAERADELSAIARAWCAYKDAGGR